MAQISADSIVAAACNAAVTGSDALFFTCTAVRAAGVIDRIEAATGIPAVSANLATAWAALRACGDDGAASPGRLMSLTRARA